MTCLREGVKTPVVKERLHKLEIIGANWTAIRLTRKVGIGSRSQEELEEDKIKNVSYGHWDE